MVYNLLTIFYRTKPLAKMNTHKDILYKENDTHQYKIANDKGKNQV